MRHSRGNAIAIECKWPAAGVGRHEGVTLGLEDGTLEGLSHGAWDQSIDQ